MAKRKGNRRNGRKGSKGRKGRKGSKGSKKSNVKVRRCQKGAQCREGKEKQSPGPSTLVQCESKSPKHTKKAVKAGHADKAAPISPERRLELRQRVTEALSIRETARFCRQIKHLDALCRGKTRLAKQIGWECGQASHEKQDPFFWALNPLPRRGQQL